MLDFILASWKGGNEGPIQSNRWQGGVRPNAHQSTPKAATVKAISPCGRSPCRVEVEHQLALHLYYTQGGAPPGFEDHTECFYSAMDSSVLCAETCWIRLAMASPTSNPIAS